MNVSSSFRTGGCFMLLQAQLSISTKNRVAVINDFSRFHALYSSLLYRSAEDFQIKKLKLNEEMKVTGIELTLFEALATCY